MSFPLPPLVRRKDTEFDIGILLGRGTFTSVYAAVEKKTGLRCAMKIVDRYRCERLKKTADLYMEKHCLQRTNHSNIIKMLGWFSDNTNIFVMLEECLGGELWEVIKTVGCPVGRARHYLAQVVNAVSYLRQANIVHRDLKAENIMLTELGVVKLIDFGTAKDLENPHIKGSGNEVIENKSSDHRSDICFLREYPLMHVASSAKWLWKMPMCVSVQPTSRISRDMPFSSNATFIKYIYSQCPCCLWQICACKGLAAT
ncbi:unnamed protein product [Durusdinium trenchii]|uniref:Protein kinase domain-containing protein n=1 Tax=Durusdinium trenchii TaxID=1381693 RepID=A0ABP0NZH3_9DINO